MSYILKNQFTPLLKTTLTDRGRNALASGKLNFAFYAFGDSEIDYRYTLLTEENILCPKANNPSIKTFLLKNDYSKFKPITIKDIDTVYTDIHNKIDSVGFFDKTTLAFDESKFTTKGLLGFAQFNGNNIIDLHTQNFSNGDFLIIRFDNDSTKNTNHPAQWLTYKIKRRIGNSSVELDRSLPNYIDYTGIYEYPFYILPKNDGSFFDSNDTLVWDYNTLTFKQECIDDNYNFWNFNIVYQENVIGTTLTQFDFTKYKSFDYIGQINYLCEKYNSLIAVKTCDDSDFKKDTFLKNIGILHYTNKNLKNHYGDYFFIDDNNQVEIEIPNILHYKRLNGSGGQLVSGLSLRSLDVKKTITNTDIEYYDLVEHTNNLNPTVVGKVYTTLKVIVIEDQEILSALTYKTNRNYSLPNIDAILKDNVNGILEPNKRIFVTYGFRSSNLSQEIIPCQSYIYADNITKKNKDVECYFSNVEYLKYLVKKETEGINIGYSFTKFDIMYQIVDIGERPLSHAWKTIEYTNTQMTGGINQSIIASVLGSQRFLINDAYTSTELTYTNTLGYAAADCADSLYFGEEYVFIGNIKTSIGATTYKNVLNLKLDEGEFLTTENPTFTNQLLHFDEIGIYDDLRNLVMIGKLYKPFEIHQGSLNVIEMMMDF